MYDDASYGNKTGSLQYRWSQLDNSPERLNMLDRCELYAGWTLPYVLTQKNTASDERQGPLDSIGARAVNHLSNKLIKTLFSWGTPFFRLGLTNAVTSAITAQNPQNAPDILSKAQVALSAMERQGIKNLVKMAYRTAAILSGKNLIICGNSLLYHPPKELGKNSKTQVYNLRDYCVCRDPDGTMVELLMRDKKEFNSFSIEIQNALSGGGHHGGPYGDTAYTVYTQVKLQPDGKYHVYQSAENVDLDTHAIYPKKYLPWIPLTWNLARCENYGRGLVEDYAGAFHALAVLSQSQVELAAEMADIKYLVNPASTIDVVTLNEGRSGTYLTGKAEDITVVQANKQGDAQFIANMVDRLERQISQGFLLTSGTTRDAERVTAFEIEQNVNELEESLGGIYSREAEEWQVPLVYLILDGMEVDIGTGKAIEPEVTTGVDTLSRNGELTQFQQAMGDLNLTSELPEPFQQRLSPKRTIEFVFNNRGLDYTKVMATDEEVQAVQQQEMQQQAALQAQQNQGGVQQAAAKEAMKEQ